MPGTPLTTAMLSVLCVSVLFAQVKAPFQVQPRPGLADSAPLLPKTMHFCAAHCSTLVWDKNHFTNASDPGGSIWSVESFTRESVIIRRTDTRPRPFAAVYRAKISNVGDTINGDGYKFAWGAALNSIPGSDEERDGSAQQAAARNNHQNAPSENSAPSAATTQRQVGNSPPPQVVLMPQRDVTNQPFDVREGFWQATLTRHQISQLPASLLEQFPPEQRASIVASAKAEQDKGTVQKKNVCLDAKNLQAGTFMGGDTSCRKEMTSSSQKLEVRFKCGQTDSISHFERSTFESFKGSTRYTIPNANPPITVNETLVANWIGGHCPTQAEQMQARGIAVGANPDVLSFLPYIPAGAEGRLGRFFVYYWNAGPGPDIPMIGYQNAFPGAPSPGSAVRLYFNGTDGKYLYVTFVEHGQLCGGKSYKIDKSGNPTQVPEIPLGLKGGSDADSGGPCRITKPR